MLDVATQQETRSCIWHIVCNGRNLMNKTLRAGIRKTQHCLFLTLSTPQIWYQAFESCQLMNFTCSLQGRKQENKLFFVMSALDSALLLPLTSVSCVWSSAIFLSYIIFLSDTMAIKLNRISPSLYLKREAMDCNWKVSGGAEIHLK